MEHRSVELRTLVFFSNFSGYLWQKNGKFSIVSQFGVFLFCEVIFLLSINCVINWAHIGCKSFLVIFMFQVVFLFFT